MRHTHTTALSFQQDFEDDWQLWTVRHSLGPKCNCGDAFDPYIRAGGSDHAGKVRCKTCKKIMRGGVIPFFTGTKLPLVALFGILYGTLHGHSQKFIQELTCVAWPATVVLVVGPRVTSAASAL